MLLITYGTEWPILCWCAVKKLYILTHSRRRAEGSCPNTSGGFLELLGYVHVAYQVRQNKVAP